MGELMRFEITLIIIFALCVIGIFCKIAWPHERPMGMPQGYPNNHSHDTAEADKKEEKCRNGIGTYIAGEGYTNVIISCPKSEKHLKREAEMKCGQAFSSCAYQHNGFPYKARLEADKKCTKVWKDCNRRIK